MIEHRKLDLKKSEEVYECCSVHVALKQCYVNVFNIATSAEYCDKFLGGDWKIAYGYMPSSINTAYIRHCFIVDTKADSVIDPTRFAANREVKSDNYIVFAEIPFEEWLGMIAANDFMPSCEKQLEKEERRAFEYASRNGLTFFG